jgi:peptide/nickel transport system substrate-binding protein
MTALHSTATRGRWLRAAGAGIALVMLVASACSTAQGSSTSSGATTPAGTSGGGASGAAGSSGAASAPGGSSDSSGNPFTVNWNTSVSSLDPAFVCPGDDNSLASNFYGRLVKLATIDQGNGMSVANNDVSSVQPDLATSWTVSPDGKTYTFKLRSGATFANGDPLDAAAVKYSLDRTIKIGACGALSLQVGITKPPLFQEVDAPDATTVVIHLREPNPNVIYTLALSRGSIYDPKVIEANGGVVAGQPNKYLTSHTASSSGPYVLKEYVPNNYALLERNPNYYGTPAKEAVVRINFITSVPTLLLQAENGQADVTLGLPPQSVKSLDGKACCRVVTANSITPVTVSMNYGGPVTGNEKFREALTYAVPYQDIINKIAYGYGDSYYGPLVPGMSGYQKDLEPARAYDPAKAKALLAESGLKNPTLDLMINPTAPGVSDIAALLQAAWQAIGVTVNLDAKAPADFSTLFNDGKYSSALLFENSLGIGSYELYKKMGCDSPFNNQHICIDGSQPLMTQLTESTDAKTQQPIIDQLVKMWLANSPTIILYRAQFTAVLGKDVKSFLYQPNLTVSQWSR